MSDRPTQETDAEYKEANDYEPSAFVEPLAKFLAVERERDEARDAAAMWESSSDAMERAGAEQARRADENCEWALRAERERNEAREALIEARKHREQLNSLLQSYEACWDEIKTTLGEPEEGDQTCDLDRVLKAIRERNEAREALMKIEEIFIDGGDTYLDFVRVGNIATDYLEGL